jgi:hypothetical protein
MKLRLLVLSLMLTATWACAPLIVIPGTKVADTKMNRELIDVCERYRRALEERDAPALLSLAHPQYFEDSGTPLGADDYGYEGLKDVLSKRLSAVKTLRYNIEYRKIEVLGTRVHVDIRYDASFQIATEMGDRWERKQNDKRIELENDGKRWLFISGM